MVIESFLPSQGMPRAGDVGVRARPSEPRFTRGFTLIELLMVVSVLAVLMVVAVPSFKYIITSTRIKNASFDVFSTLTMARSEAITRNTTATVARTGGSWANGWTVTVPDPVSGAPLTIRHQDPYPGITITNSVANFSFNGSGRASVSASFSIDAPGASDAQKRCVIIGVSGRPVTKPVVNTGFACP